MLANKLLFFIIIIASLTGCKSKKNNAPNTTVSEAKKKFEIVNKALVQKDKERISAYIERHKLDGMQENQSGLYYLIWGNENGNKVKKGDIVLINYKVELLDGTLCYNTFADNKPIEFMVSKGGVEAGLELAILLMHQGQKGKFIMPPHLAHGLLGDNDKIPPMAVLVFDVELLAVIES